MFTSQNVGQEKIVPKSLIDIYQTKHSRSDQISQQGSGISIQNTLVV